MPVGARIVVTGLGLVTPLGSGVDSTWRRLINGESGLTNPTKIPLPDEFPSQVVGEVPVVGPYAFDVNEWLNAKDQKRSDVSAHYLVAVAKQACADAGFGFLPDGTLDLTEGERAKIGIVSGTGIGGISSIELAANRLQDRGLIGVSPTFISSALANSAPGLASIILGIMGPNHSIISACASSAHAVMDAARIIKLGEADVMLACGSEYANGALSVSGFSTMRALSTHFNDRPHAASRPWDKSRDGFVMAEGAGAIVLESEIHARKRGARIYGELVGYGATGDAYHIVAPHREGKGALAAMRNALSMAQCNVDNIDYISAHATSTQAGDVAEMLAVQQLFSSRTGGTLYMSAIKSALGHMLGGCGVVASALAILSIVNGVIPPTVNLDNVMDEAWSVVDLVPKVAKSVPCRWVLSNSFGFGGTNASLLFREYGGS